LVYPWLPSQAFKLMNRQNRNNSRKPLPSKPNHGNGSNPGDQDTGNWSSNPLQHHLHLPRNLLNKPQQIPHLTKPLRTCPYW